ncbi:MAG: hypothetical protein J6U54_17975 [Clostridiales bacterium]|nr:hypothetical protein [Clostridiales bacterium]
MKITFGKKQKEPTERELRKAFIRSEMKQIEEYMKSIAPGNEEYDVYHSTWQRWNSELMDIEKAENEDKFKLSDLLPWLTIALTAGGTVAGVYTSVHKDKTKKELGDMIYQKEEVEDALGNGKLYSLSTKD